MEGIATASEVGNVMSFTSVNGQVSIFETLTSILTRLSAQADQINEAVNEVEHLMEIFGIVPETTVRVPVRRVVAKASTKRTPTKKKVKRSTRKAVKKSVRRKRKVGPLTERENEAVAIFKKHQGFVSPETIGKAMKIEAKSVSSLVHSLKTKGVNIESAKSVRNSGGEIPASASGYRLVGTTSKS